MHDLKFAFRQLAKSPGFTVVAVLTLALGIGSSSAMFGLIRGVLLSPPPYARPDRLILISTARTDGQPYKRGCTIGQWSDWRKGNKTLQDLSLYVWTFNFLILPEGSESLEGMYVTRNYFDVLGLKPLLGRQFTESEAARPGSGPSAIIIGYDLWQRRFNGDRNILGKTIHISRNPDALPIIGVMPPQVRFLPDPGTSSEPNYDLNARVDFWLCAIPDETKPKDDGWNVVGRLREGATLAGAQAEFNTLAARQAANDRDLEGITAVVQPVQDELNREGRRLLVPLSCAVALVFLVACGNVSGLLLARGLRRQPEYAVRCALGAGRRRLFRQVLTESLAVAVLGACLGAVLAMTAINLLKLVGARAVPRLDAVTIGWPVFAFCLGVAVVAGGFAGLLPAWRASRQAPFQSLKSSRSGTGRAERRLLGTVAMLQTGLTMALLVGAALLIRTAHNLSSVRPGYQTENVLAMTVTMVQRDHWKEFHTLALDRVSALPGVKQAAFVWGLPLTGNKWTGTMEIVGQPVVDPLKDRLLLPLRSVTPDYFDALGMRLVNGRGFRASDDDKAPSVAVINEALAARYFPALNPIGRQMRFAGDTNRVIEIVGVLGDTRTEDLSQQADPEIYFPFWQSGAFSKHLLVRTAADPRPLAAMVRREIHAIDPTAAVEHIQTMEDIRRDSVASRTFAMRLLVAFSVVASVLALVGIYGVLSLSVGSRTKEIAVRVAIGAQRSEILRLILGDGLRLVGLGLALGAVVALCLGNLLATFLFQVKPTDPVTLVSVAVLFAAVALLACWLPARRATRIDPMEALRDE